MNRRRASTPADSWPGEKWVEDGAWSQDEVPADKDADNTCRFRLEPALLQLASELREDAASPFFGMFRTKSALYRHIMTRGLIAMGETYKATRGMAESLRIKEEVLASALSNRIERKRRNEAIEATIRSVGEALDDHQTEAAAETIDRFFGGILDWDMEKQRQYAVALLAHPAFQRLKSDWLLLEASKYLKDFVQTYGG